MFITFVQVTICTLFGALIGFFAGKRVCMNKVLEVLNRATDKTSTIRQAQILFYIIRNLSGCSDEECNEVLTDEYMVKLVNEASKNIGLTQSETNEVLKNNNLN